MDKSTFIKIDKSWTLFLDRDGVINRRLIADYVKTIEQFELLEGVKEAVIEFYQLFNCIIVVTNQQGIGKGLMTESDLSEIHKHMLDELKYENYSIDAVYHAPQLMQEKSPMRKPNIGMALAAKNDFPQIEFHKSIMVGDTISDMEFGKKAGMITVFVGEERIENRHIDYSIRRLSLLKEILKEE